MSTSSRHFRVVFDDKVSRYLVESAAVVDGQWSSHPEDETFTSASDANTAALTSHDVARVFRSMSGEGDEPTVTFWEEPHAPS